MEKFEFKTWTRKVVKKTISFSFLGGLVAICIGLKRKEPKLFRTTLQSMGTVGILSYSYFGVVEYLKIKKYTIDWKIKSLFGFTSGFLIQKLRGKNLNTSLKSGLFISSFVIICNYLYIQYIVWKFRKKLELEGNEDLIVDNKAKQLLNKSKETYKNSKILPEWLTESHERRYFEQMNEVKKFLKQKKEQEERENKKD